MIGKIILLMVGVFGAGMACGNILVDRIALPEQEDVLRGQNFFLQTSPIKTLKPDLACGPFNDQKSFEQNLVNCNWLLPDHLDIQYVDTKFSAGDIVVDFVTRDVGFLLERFDVMEHSADKSLHGRIFAWDVLWTGAKIKYCNKYSPHTETGLRKCILDGVLQHYPNI